MVPVFITDESQHNVLCKVIKRIMAVAFLLSIRLTQLTLSTDSGYLVTVTFASMILSSADIIVKKEYKPVGQKNFRISFSFGFYRPSRLFHSF